MMAQHWSQASGTVLDRICSLRIVPVVVLDNPDQAQSLAEALAAGDLPIAEVTLRSPGALDVLVAMSESEKVLVGAGTVRTAAQAQRCLESGAQFLVSPGLSEGVLRVGEEAGVPVLPGVATPTEIMRAVDLGVSTVKLFPASIIGGPPAVRALSGPFPDVRFVPTGGVDESSAAAYLSLPSVAAIGGSWIVTQALLATGDFDEIRRRAIAARSLTDTVIA
jgi:2-dehydro-3-deoxyphosphogluconate aldolase/(4S)-4-hydroxy-2-oxoglutarate aldolase